MVACHFCGTPVPPLANGFFVGGQVQPACVPCWDQQVFAP
jgi:hypothetical protein